MDRALPTVSDDPFALNPIRSDPSNDIPSQINVCRMSRVLTALARLPRLLLVGLVRAYQLLLSPHLGRTCRFHPTCSQYAIEALRKYGAVRGLLLTVYRLARCHPWGGHGYDPPRWFTESPETDTAADASTSASPDRPDQCRSHQS